MSAGTMSVFEERAAEALRTSQAIGRDLTQELKRIGRIAARINDPEKVRKLYHGEVQAFMAEWIGLTRQAVRMAKELA